MQLLIHRWWKILYFWVFFCTRGPPRGQYHYLSGLVEGSFILRQTQNLCNTRCHLYAGVWETNALGGIRLSVRPWFHPWTVTGCVFVLRLKSRVKYGSSTWSLTIVYSFHRGTFLQWVSAFDFTKIKAFTFWLQLWSVLKCKRAWRHNYSLISSNLFVSNLSQALQLLIYLKATVLAITLHWSLFIMFM